MNKALGWVMSIHPTSARLFDWETDVGRDSVCEDYTIGDKWSYHDKDQIGRARNGNQPMKQRMKICLFQWC